MKIYKLPLPLVLIIYLLCACKSSPSEDKVAVSEEKSGPEENWQPLFNHENLEGWEALPGGNWEVQQGTIIGTSPAEEPLHGILLSDKTYSDFKLKII